MFLASLPIPHPGGKDWARPTQCVAQGLLREECMNQVEQDGFLGVNRHCQRAGEQRGQVSGTGLSTLTMPMLWKTSTESPGRRDAHRS